MSEQSGEVVSVQEIGIPLEKISRLARLGLLFENTRMSHGDGTAYPVAKFSFILDSPLGRANVACGIDVDILDGIIKDAETLHYDEFAARFPHFGPY